MRPPTLHLCWLAALACAEASVPVVGGPEAVTRPPEAGAARDTGAAGEVASAPMGTITFQIPPDSEPERALPACKREVPVPAAGALNAALASAAPGDCLILAAGSYPGFKLTGKTGTAEAPIVVRAQSRLGAVIDSGQVVVQSSAHLVFDGLTIATPSTLKMIDCQSCRFTRCKFALTVQDDWLLIHGNGSKNNRIDHNDFGPKPSPGPFLVIGQEDTMSTGDRIDHNHFHDNGPPAINEKESVRIGWSGVWQREGKTVVEHNLFENCDGDPEIISVKTFANVVRYNTVRTSAGVISLRHGNGSWVYGNFILAGRKNAPCMEGTGTCPAGGIRLYGQNHKVFNNYIEGSVGTGHRAPIQIDGGDGSSATSHHQVVGAIVVANTLVDNESGIEIGKNYSQPPRDSVVGYNLVRSAAGKAIQVFKPQSTIRFAGNMVWTGGAATTMGVTLSEPEARVIDPRLEKVGELFRLAAGSPAIDGAAALTGTLMVDIDGQPRATPDVGADEWGTGTRRPLTKQDVGPIGP